MIDKTILHYPPETDLLLRRMSLWLKPLADKILEKLGEPACPAYRQAGGKAGVEWAKTLFGSEL